MACGCVRARIAGISYYGQVWVDEDRPRLDLERLILREPREIPTDEVLDLGNREPSIFGRWLLKGAEQTMRKQAIPQQTALPGDLVLASCPNNEEVGTGTQVRLEVLQGNTRSSTMTDIQEHHNIMCSGF